MASPRRGGRSTGRELTIDVRRESVGESDDVYEAAYGHCQERCSLLLLDGFLLRPEYACAEGGDVTSWLFDEEPKLFGSSAGAGSQDDWVEVTMPGSRATMNRSKRHSLLPAGCEGGSDTEQFVSASLRQRKGQW